MVILTDVQCALCGLSTRHPVRGADGAEYCCSACDQVAQLLLEPVEKTQEYVAAQENTETLTLNLEGLWCSSCAWLIEERLKRGKGIASAQVSFIQHQAQIDYDPGKTSQQKIARQIKKLGYRSNPQNSDPQQEEESFFTRLILGGMLAMNIMATSAIMYVRELMGIASVETQWLSDFFYIMQFVIFIPLVIILGLPILRAGIASLLRGLPSTHTLVAIGSISAFILSARNLYLQSGHVYFDTAAMLLFLISIGRWLEMKAHRASRETIDNMLKYVPDSIRVLENGEAKELALNELLPGARVNVLPGEPIPVDGIIAKGQGDIDESLLSGESKPVFRQSGDQLFAGSINLDGEFEIIASAIGAQSRAGQIAAMLQEAMWQRAPVERLADRIAAWMVPIAIALAGITFMYWNHQSGLEVALFNSLSVLLIACPCALGLATPLTLWQALGKANQNGVILRSTAVLEKIQGLRKIFFDKTGTLSRLPLKIQNVFALSGDGENEKLLQMAASLEFESKHPLGRAIVQEAHLRSLEFLPATDCQTLPGRGVRGLLNGDLLHVGNQQLMRELGLLIPADMQKAAQSQRQNGAIISYIAREGEILGFLSIGERIRDEVQDMMMELRAQDIDLAVITGDDRSSAERWQRILDVPVIAELMPEQKLVQLRDSGPFAAMVGDGINDGPALAAAHVGIAMHAGTDIARASADVVLANENLLSIPWLLSLTQEASKRVKQNLAWALVYNMVGIALAASGILQPILAAFAMVISSFLVTRNALQLRRFPDLNADTLPEPLNSSRIDFRHPLEDIPA